jgi:hypothetical protein
METHPERVRQAGYVELPRLSEIIRDALRAYTREEGLAAGRILIREIISWVSLSNEESIGLLESAKQKFLFDNEDNYDPAVMDRIRIMYSDRTPRKITRKNHGTHKISTTKGKGFKA